MAIDLTKYQNSELIEDVRNRPGPQQWNNYSKKFEPSSGSDGARHAKITDKFGAPIDPREVNVEKLEAKLDALNQKVDGILDGSSPANTQLTGSFVEYRILSTEPYPSAVPEEKGATLVIMDTGEVFMNHGSSWGVW
ncbi:MULTISPECIES: hypothetical protein [Pontibacillus]|uniref:Uncharacterized protein n=1 Tax=Pontibacillus chungwhensis TaxID=265426 RepID=A0ABY8UYK2_9BACI|nr:MULTISPECIES: hypothetical protein [Pontibacillus]MCD5324792.1 hypothetical protein [Pontibacillus sp. HN14]WIF98751.1 hypothetical protein QNI29_03610 [Pontibacillus chungwhensis]